jgi:hypothetical protein
LYGDEKRANEFRITEVMLRTFLLLNFGTKDISGLSCVVNLDGDGLASKGLDGELHFCDVGAESVEPLRKKKSQKIEGAFWLAFSARQPCVC